MPHVLGDDPHGLFDHARHAVNRYLASRRQMMHRYDDIFSAACEGVTKAHQTFDVERGVSFEWWALRKARSAIVDEIRRTSPLTRDDYRKGVRVEDVPSAQEAHSVDALSEMFETDAWEWLTPAADESDELKRADDRDALRRLIKHLTPKQQYIIYKTDFEDVTYIELAREFGVSESRICQIRKQALDCMRKRAA